MSAPDSGKDEPTKCPQCGSGKVAPTLGNGVGNTMDCLNCYTDFTPAAPSQESREKPVDFSGAIDPRLRDVDDDPDNEMLTQEVAAHLAASTESDGELEATLGKLVAQGTLHQAQADWFLAESRSREEKLREEYESLRRDFGDMRGIVAPLEREIATLRAENEKHRDSEFAYQQDVGMLLGALGLGDHARDISAHLVVQREIIPAISQLRASALTPEEVSMITHEHQFHWYHLNCIRNGAKACAECAAITDKLRSITTPQRGGDV